MASVKWATSLKYVFLLLLLVLFSVVYKMNTYGASLFNYSVVGYIIIWFAFLTLVFVGGSRLVKKEEAILYALFIGGFLLSYGEIQDFLLNHWKLKWLAANWFLMPFFLLILLAGRLLLRKRQLAFKRTYNFLLLLLGVFVLLEVFKMATLKRSHFYDYKAAQPPVVPMQVNADALPDVYYIVFDSYTSTNALAAYWHFSNAGLDSFLQQQQFAVTTNSHSAYNFTTLSINAIFNLNYLPITRGALERDYINFNYGRKIFDDALVTNWFTKQGYQVDCNSIVSLKQDNDLFYPFIPDEPLHWLRRQTVERLWIVPSLRNKIFSLLGIDKKYPGQEVRALHEIDDYNKRLLNTLTHQPADTSIRRFVYAHFNLPHGPFLYKQDGSPRPVKEAVTADKAKMKAYYLEQIVYTNNYIRQIVTSLRQTGKKNKVIILQGDHGHREIVPGETGDPYAVLNAVYFPDKDYRHVSDSMLTINTFRLVLNKYFNQQLPLISARPPLQ